jgi:hypothetical protein
LNNYLFAKTLSSHSILPYLVFFFCKEKSYLVNTPPPHPFKSPFPHTFGHWIPSNTEKVLTRRKHINSWSYIWGEDTLLISKKVSIWLMYNI